MLFLDAHGYGFTIGIAFLTIHVFVLGYLIFKSGYFPKVLGVLFIAAGVGYLVDSFALLLSPAYETTPGYYCCDDRHCGDRFPIMVIDQRA